MGQHQTKKLLHAKEKHQPNEDRLLNGRKYLQIMFDKGFISKIYKELIQLKRKKKEYNLKMGRRPEQTFFQRCLDGQQVHVKMLKSLIRGMQSKTTRSYHLTPVRMAIFKKVRNVWVWRKVMPFSLLVEM